MRSPLLPQLAKRHCSVRTSATSSNISIAASAWEFTNKSIERNGTNASSSVKVLLQFFAKIRAAVELHKVGDAGKKYTLFIGRHEPGAKQTVIIIAAHDIAEPTIVERTATHCISAR
jgi:hypothetical protein